MAQNRLPMVGVRMEQSLRDQIKAEADARFGGNESLVLREGAALYLKLRRKLGVQFEPTLALWLGPDEAAADERVA